jgi:hypothetical protein
MRRVGNVASNRIYNPQNTRPPIPIDADEQDSAMERFIRGKYQDRAITSPTRHNTGSTNSDDHPPPLPPKTGSRFGFRSASSMFPLSSKARREAARNAEFESDEREREERERHRRRTPSPPRKNRPVQRFGASDGDEEPDDSETKLARLRDMGFLDERKNRAVLRGLSGNLEKSIEALVRLGARSNSAKSREDLGPPSRAQEPSSPGTGISISGTGEKSAQSPNTSTNPFDMLDAKPAPAQPQSSQSTGSMAQRPMAGNNPFQQAANPAHFGLVPSQSQYSLNQAFQNMTVSSPQPLFPNHTGGVPAQQQSQQQQLYQQPMTPPVPSMPRQFHTTTIYENPGQQQQSYNPFIQQQQQLRQPPPINSNFQPNPYVQQMSATSTQNMYSSPIESPMQQHNPYFANSAQQSPIQQTLFQNGFPASSIQQHQNQFPNNSQQYAQQQPQQGNPFLGNMAQPVRQHSYDIQPTQHTQYEQYRQQTLPTMSTQGLRADSRSILDLYNQTQFVSSPLQQQQNQNQMTSQAPGQVFQQQQQPRSVSNPVSNSGLGSTSMNPFINSGGVDSSGAMAQNQNGTRHISQESVSVDAGWYEGRHHSPEAWGTISSSTT